MDEQREDIPAQTEDLPKFRGLYRHVNISVRTLDSIIVACIAVIVILVALELRNPALTVTFEAKGGTDVSPQHQMYGELLTLPEPPTREGYRFTGWYRDAACFVPWDTGNDIIETDMTLYAGWEQCSESTVN